MKPWLTVWLSPFEALQAIVAERSGAASASALRDYSARARYGLSFFEGGDAVRRDFANAADDLQAWCRQGLIEGKGRRVIDAFGRLEAQPESLEDWWSNQRAFDFEQSALKGHPIFREVELRGADVRRSATPAPSLPAIVDADALKQKEAVAAVSYKTGAIGRPTSAWLCIQELKRRINTEEAVYSQSAECEYLSIWLKEKHNDAPPIKGKALENNPDIKILMRLYKAKSRKEKP